MADHELVPEAILEKDGLKVSESPWGPDDEIGRLNWITPDTNKAILEHLDGSHLFDLNVEYFIGMPSWVAAGDPPYGIWMTHTPQGSINDNLSGVGPTAHERYSYCGDSIHLYTHCGTHVDTLNHLGHHGMFWNGWTADKDLGSRIWNKGGLDKYPPIISRAVLLDVAGMKGVDCLPEGYGITPQDLQDTAEKQGTDIPPKSVVLVRTGRMTVWPDFDGYLLKPPGINLAAAPFRGRPPLGRHIPEPTKAMEQGIEHPVGPCELAPRERTDTLQDRVAVAFVLRQNREHERRRRSRHQVLVDVHARLHGSKYYT